MFSDVAMRAEPSIQGAKLPNHPQDKEKRSICTLIFSGDEPPKSACPDILITNPTKNIQLCTLKKIIKKIFRL